MSTEYLVDKNKDSIDVFCMGVKSVFMLTCLTSEVIICMLHNTPRCSSNSHV